MRIVFFGDSITAGDKSSFNKLGSGYVSILAKRLSEDAKLSRYEIVNSGVNGNMVGDLLARYKRDVVQHAPDVVVIKIGINDAYNDFQEGCLSSNLKQYTDGLKQLITAFYTELPRCKILLLTPYYIVDDFGDALYLRMCEYGKTVHELGNQYHIQTFDTQRVFNEAVKAKPAHAWAADQVHPGIEGHTILADGILIFLREQLSKKD